MLNKFIMHREVKTVRLDDADIQYVKLGRKIVFLDIPNDGVIGHYLTDVSLEEIDDYHYKIKRGDKNIFIVEYEFNSGAWCGLSGCVSPYTKAFNYWVKDPSWDFITKSAGEVVETDKSFCIVKKYYKEDGVWNKTETEYIYADPDKINILDFDPTKIK
jgi:hypothetical protein